MVDLSSLVNPELKKQITVSVLFNALPDAEQLEHIKKMANLPPKQQEKFATLFAEENQTEQDTEDSQLLMQFFSELEALKHKFIKLAREDKEGVLTASEKVEQADLLNQLNNL